jgi:hypothetical protein
MPAAGFGAPRSLGPIEYLCAWFAQAEPARALSAQQFHSAARAVMDLIAASPEARALYCEKLLADVDDPISGALTRQTRQALRALVSAWSSGAPSFDASARFLSALPEARGSSLALHVAASGLRRALTTPARRAAHQITSTHVPVQPVPRTEGRWPGPLAQSGPSGRCSATASPDRDQDQFFQSKPGHRAACRSHCHP